MRCSGGGGLMDELLLTLQKELAKRNITQTELAKKIGVSVGTVNNYLKGTHRIKFFNFVKMLTCIYDDKHTIEQMIWLFLEKAQKMKAKNNKIDIVREGLEWSIHNGNMELLEYFIQEDTKLTDNGELGKIYSLLSKRNKGLFKSLEFYDELERLKLHGYKRGESAVLLKIASIYALFESQSFNLFFYEIDKALSLTEKIKNKYLKKAYTIRIKEALAVAYMVKNELPMAQKLCIELINDVDANHFPFTINSIYLLLAQIHLFNDYNKSLEYIQKALMLFEDHNFKKYERRKRRIEATHDFIKIVNKDYDGLFLTDRVEYAHYLAMQNNPELRKKAVEIIDELQKENGYLSPFQMYYKALALKSDKLMKEAEEEFLVNGNKYYAQLPRMYLQKGLLV
jgi:transcriptional regulator with XRE-family HTH domain